MATITSCTHLASQYEPSNAIKTRSRDFSLVETPSQLQAMLKELISQMGSDGSLAVDCEGVKLGAPDGQLCLMQLAVSPRPR